MTTAGLARAEEPGAKLPAAGAPVVPRPARRLLHLISTLDPRTGGPVEGLRQICTHINGTREWHADIVSLDAPDAGFLADFEAAPVAAVGPAVGKYAYSARLRPWLRRHGPHYDAIVVHGLWQYAGLAVWLERGIGVPYFQFTHGMLDPWFKHEYPLKHLKKWLYWPWAQYRILRDAAGVLFTCEEESLLAPKSFWLYQATPIVVGYGISPPPPDAAGQCRAFLDAFPELEGRRCLLFFGRLHPKKGCDLLVDAFARVCMGRPDLQLVMAGPGDRDYVGALQKQAADRGIAAQVTWTGMLSGDAKWGALRCAEAFVLPSHQENFGVAVAEAMACGTPVLISDKVNIWREIKEDAAGLVATDDAAGTVRLLSDWVALPPEARAATGARAAASYAGRFTIDRSGARLLEAIDRRGMELVRP
ncbi:MAG TPA: glycosyltransferase [Rhodocyclaceae bacterium]|nr:glycosyltransferase [Rhodocyclaceae bacterium]